MRHWVGLFAAGLALVVAGSASAAAPKCAPAGAAKGVEEAVRGWFGAFVRDDYAAGYALQAPGFYAYDGGERYDGTALGELLRKLKAGGTRLEWRLHDMDVHVACDQAWAAWINTGAAGTVGAMQPVTWLESMTLRYEGGRWRIEFLHSDRAKSPG
jgi:hypothetical protein